MPERLPPDKDAILAVDDLSVDALTPQGARRVIDGISFALAPSETLCLAGESGSGKSVTALSIMRLLPRASLRIAGGDIRLEGRSLVRLPEPVVMVGDGYLEAEVTAVDRFGNVQLAATGTSLDALDEHLLVGGVHAVRGGTFADAPPGELIVFVDSAERVAVAINGGRAVVALSVSPGDVLRIDNA